MTCSLANKFKYIIDILGHIIITFKLIQEYYIVVIIIFKSSPGERSFDVQMMINLNSVPPAFCRHVSRY